MRGALSSLSNTGASAGGGLPVVDPSVSPNVQRALISLSNASGLATELGVDVWQFAIELPGLCSQGLTTTECRWLVHQGFVEQARETSKPKDTKRKFQKCSNLGLSDATCFVISDAGNCFLSGANLSTGIAQKKAPGKKVPVWDPVMHELRYGDAIVKRFKLPAPNQQAILDTFEVEGWPERINDPLPPKRAANLSRRLQDTISSLNRNQTQPLLRFFGDGTGQGVCWELK